MRLQSILISVFVLVAVCSFQVKAQEFISIQTLAEKGLLAVEVKSLGGFSGSCVEFSIENKTSESLGVWVEAGRRLLSDNVNSQDILIVKDIKLSLLANGSQTVKAYGFCCQSSKAAPRAEETFQLGFIAPVDWLSLTDFIKANNFDESDVQLAVWCISDQHNPASLCATEKNTPAYELKKKVAEIRKLNVPWYCIKYEPDELLLFSHRHEFVSGNVDFQVRRYCSVTIQIRSETGRLIKTLVNEMPYTEGKYEIALNQKVKGWAKGKYTIHVIEDGSNLIQKTEFIL
jgi:hypothetical protein